MSISKKALTLSFAITALLAIACGVPQEEYDALEAERDAALADGTRLQQEKQSLEGTVTSLGAERDAANETISELEADNQEAGEQIAALASERDGLSGQVSELTDSVATLEASNATLMESLGELETLESRKESLETDVATLMLEIDTLRDQRAPLVPDTYMTGFICTGSMNPVINCMDEAVWLENFDPADIIVGAVIGFDPTGLDCRLSHDRVAHRVIQIKEELGVLYFLTQGDNNRKDDGCWVPETSVFAYMTELLEGDFEDMQALLDQIAPLEDQKDAILNEIDQLELDYDAAEVEYDQFLQDHCTLNGSQWTCTSPWFQTAVNMFNALQDRIDEIEAKWAEYLPVCQQARSLRTELQDLQAIHLGTSSDYTFPPC